jgi:hypothetical protein
MLALILSHFIAVGRDQTAPYSAPLFSLIASTAASTVADLRSNSLVRGHNITFCTQ